MFDDNSHLAALASVQKSVSQRVWVLVDIQFTEVVNDLLQLLGGLLVDLGVAAGFLWPAFGSKC